MKKIVLICILILLITIIVFKNCDSEGFANDENSNKLVLWEKKLLKFDDVLSKLKTSLAECGVSNISLEKTDLEVIDSRKKLIELLPVTKLLDKLTYTQIQCFVSKFEPENYLVISKNVPNVPKTLRPRNIIIVNDILYHSTPYGVLKYKLPNLEQFRGLESLNASFECGIINDYNAYNTTSNPIFHISGKIIQKKGNKFIDLRNNDNWEITDINDKIELLNKKAISKIQKDRAQGIIVKDKISQENKIIQESAEGKKLLENMVDVGGVLELKITDPTQLKVIDTKTFVPVITTVSKPATLPESPTIVLPSGKVVSEETIKQEIKQELISKGVPTSEQEAIINKNIQELKLQQPQVIIEGSVSTGKPVSEEAVINKNVQELKLQATNIVLPTGKVVSEETVKQEIKQELISKGIPVAEQEAIINKNIQELKLQAPAVVLPSGKVVSEEAIKQEIKQELTAKLATSEQQAVINKNIQELKLQATNIVLPTGKVVSEETIKQEIKQELINKGVPSSEIQTLVSKNIQEIKLQAPAVVLPGGKVVSEESIKQELISKVSSVAQQENVNKNIQELKLQATNIVLPTGKVVSEETVRQEIKQELTNKGIPLAEQQAIINKNIQEIKLQSTSIVLPDGKVVSQETVKQELSNKGVSQMDIIKATQNISAKLLSELTVPVIKKSDVNIKNLVNSLVTIFEYDGVIYMVEPNIVRPQSSWAIKVNDLLAKNKFKIMGVIPHFYYVNGVFNYRLLFILSDDFYIWVNKETVSDILDFKKEWKITFNPNIPDALPCDELKIILEQMEKANVISKDKLDLIVKNYKC